jgi:hypothetical protein
MANDPGAQRRRAVTSGAPSCGEHLLERVGYGRCERLWGGQGSGHADCVGAGQPVGGAGHPVGAVGQPVVGDVGQPLGGVGQVIGGVGVSPPSAGPGSPSGCVEKKSYIAVDSSGPAASAYCADGSPPDHAWPMPFTTQYSPSSCP